jgi:cysteine-S-conjugate beta-lyase
MIYNFDHTPDRRNSQSLKWQTYDPDVIPMWVADMDFPSPQPVIQALLDRVQHGVFGYPVELAARPGEVSELRQVLVERLARLYDWQVAPESLVFMPGVVTGLNLACQAFAAPTGGVLVQTPVYPPILNAGRTAGVVSQEMMLARRPDGYYVIDWDAFKAAMTSQTRLFILCNPHNPVGRVFCQDELEKMAEICLQHRVIICSDEIHCDLIYAGQRHIPVASLDPEIADQTMTLIAPSKTFNLAGLQCSIAIIQNAELRKQFVSAGKGLVPWVNLMGLVAAQAAYTDGDEWLEQLLSYLQGNRDYLVNTVRNELPGIELASPEGTYLAWLDCRNARIAGSPYHFFLEKARLAFNDGVTFGVGNEQFIRLNFGCSRTLLAEVLERMKRVLL